MSITSLSPNDMNISNRCGCLPNLTKKEFADLLLQFADQVLDMKDHESRTYELADGRLLRFWHIVFPAGHGLPELREWAVHLYTLGQRTPRSLRKWKERQAWLYLAPYEGDFTRATYKTDPTGKWSYRVWR